MDGLLKAASKRSQTTAILSPPKNSIAIALLLRSACVVRAEHGVLGSAELTVHHYRSVV